MTRKQALLKIYFMKMILVVALPLLFASRCISQDLVTAANTFIATLDEAAKNKTVYPFDTEERYAFHFVPMDRNGVSWNELTPVQRKAAMGLLKTCLSEAGVKKAAAIMQLETVLKALEGRTDDDHYRDSGRYYFTIFGVPGSNTIWGWRIEGHHLSLTFSADKKNLVSGTPAFMGANPAVVRSGPQQGKQVLKEETDQAFALLNSLSGEQLKKAVVSATAPNDILTFTSRKAMIEQPAGIPYTELTTAQQAQLLQLTGVYVRRYTKPFADAMLNEIKDAGLENLRFAWAGVTVPEEGKPHYYRIQGPTIIIEYDNTQNGANHIHSVLRDLKRDFGGDLLLQHYKTAHGAGEEE
jgi:hypothetical protein